MHSIPRFPQHFRGHFLFQWSPGNAIANVLDACLRSHHHDGFMRRRRIESKGADGSLSHKNPTVDLHNEWLNILHTVDLADALSENVDPIGRARIPAKLQDVTNAFIRHMSVEPALQTDVGVAIYEEMYDFKIGFKELWEPTCGYPRLGIAPPKMPGLIGTDETNQLYGMFRTPHPSSAVCQYITKMLLALDTARLDVTFLALADKHMTATGLGNDNRPFSEAVRMAAQLSIVAAYYALYASQASLFFLHIHKNWTDSIHAMALERFPESRSRLVKWMEFRNRLLERPLHPLLSLIATGVSGSTTTVPNGEEPTKVTWYDPERIVSIVRSSGRDIVGLFEQSVTRKNLLPGYNNLWTLDGRSADHETMIDPFSLTQVLEDSKVNHVTDEVANHLGWEKLSLAGLKLNLDHHDFVLTDGRQWSGDPAKVMLGLAHSLPISNRKLFVIDGRAEDYWNSDRMERLPRPRKRALAPGLPLPGTPLTDGPTKEEIASWNPADMDVSAAFVSAKVESYTNLAFLEHEYILESMVMGERGWMAVDSRFNRYVSPVAIEVLAHYLSQSPIYLKADPVYELDTSANEKAITLVNRMNVESIGSTGRQVVGWDTEWNPFAFGTIKNGDIAKRLHTDVMTDNGLLAGKPASRSVLALELSDILKQIGDSSSERVQLVKDLMGEGYFRLRVPMLHATSKTYMSYSANGDKLALLYAWDSMMYDNDVDLSQSNNHIDIAADIVKVRRKLHAAP